jgi:hypothetical protein
MNINCAKGVAAYHEFTCACVQCVHTQEGLEELHFTEE